MSQTYQAVYSSSTRIRNRYPQIDSGMNPQLYDYQQYVDQIVDRGLQSSLGSFDANGFRIQLPLNGTFPIVDIRHNVIILPMDTQIEMAADNLVIALFFSDKAENYEKEERAEAYLKDLIRTKFGGAISVDQDLSTDFLLQDYFTWSDGIPWALDDGSGLVLISQNPRDFSHGNSSNPDSRVIFVPAPP